LLPLGAGQQNQATSGEDFLHPLGAGQQKMRDEKAAFF